MVGDPCCGGCCNSCGCCLDRVGLLGTEPVRGTIGTADVDSADCDGADDDDDGMIVEDVL